MSDAFWKDGLGPMLGDVETVASGALQELAAKLASKRLAVFIVEPVQVEAGMRIPDREYLKQAQVLCRRYGTLFVLDEVQTGFYRTGPFLAAHHFGVLKVAPPLMIEEAQLEHFVSAIGQIVELMHTSASLWTEALGMARRVINSI